MQKTKYHLIIKVTIYTLFRQVLIDQLTAYQSRNRLQCTVNFID